ncbi:hypothetical protein [Nocardioides sp. Root140]|uniref:hypothetical protein n=1 Tax=Nocardioides sp. Root140 TaxID=1736460 RepID=UPI0006F3798A|nr:hypothetical protein [Nocardioides sp. Root140]KQY64049.1 hypothetical protein ASD30_03520 [Nocardioides sp. Root140]
MFTVGGRVRSKARAALKSYAIFRPMQIDARLEAMRRLVERADPALFELRDLTRHEARVFSQNGEDGVISEILNRLGTTNRWFVEFGVQGGHEGNCVLLADVFGWNGLFIDGDPADFECLSRKYAGNGRVRTVHTMVTAANIDRCFIGAGVPEEIDVLSIDIDGNDVHVWRQLAATSPRLVVIEYNSGIPAGGALAQPHDPARSWDGSGAFGASLEALDVVAAEKGYRLAHTDLTGNNAFYVRADLWDRLGVDEAPRRSQNFGLTGVTQPPSEPPGGWASLG